MAGAHVTLSQRDEFVIATLHGEIDLSNVHVISDYLVEATSNDVTAVVLDLSSVTYLDSAGLKMLFDFARRLRPKRQNVSLVVPGGSLIGRIVKLSNISEILPVAETVDEGIEKLKV